MSDPDHRTKNEPHYTGHRDRLRDRFRQGGSAAIADYELLELILFRALPRRAGEFLTPDMCIALLIAIPLSGVTGDIAAQFSRWSHGRHGAIFGWARSFVTISLLILCLGTLASGTHNPFIYFNF